MPNIATALKAEIARVARKEIRSETESLKKAVTAYRKEIASLKKRMQGLERQAKVAGHRRSEPATPERDSLADSPQLRFSPGRLAKQREKLGLSAADFAKLLGVSALSVYKWESGKSRPRRAQL